MLMIQSKSQENKTIQAAPLTWCYQKYDMIDCGTFKNDKSIITTMYEAKSKRNNNVNGKKLMK